MLKVECESCKAPYQIDERRVPAAGLKMRCPKCGHSFVVKSAAGAAAPPTAAASAPTGAPRAAKPAEGAPAKPPAVPVPAAKPAAVAAVKPPTVKSSLPRPPPADDSDLPSPAADLPVAVRPSSGPLIQKRGAATTAGVPGPAAPRVVRAGLSAPPLPVSRAPN